MAEIILFRPKEIYSHTISCFQRPLGLLHIASALQSKGFSVKLIKVRSIQDKAQIECPSPDESRRRGSRGRIKRSKARKPLERLIDFEQETLRFMDGPIVPFTDNQGENDIRMTKVQQKISGCFRSEKGAAIFCRIQSYLSTCRKHDMGASEA